MYYSLLAEQERIMWQKAGGLLLVSLLSGCAQEAASPVLQPQGEYRLLPLETTRRQVDELLQGKPETVIAVQAKPNGVTPPVLFALAYQLYQQQHYHDAMFWFYITQLGAPTAAQKSQEQSVQ